MEGQELGPPAAWPPPFPYTSWGVHVCSAGLLLSRAGLWSCLLQEEEPPITPVAVSVPAPQGDHLVFAAGPLWQARRPEASLPSAHRPCTPALQAESADHSWYSCAAPAAAGRQASALDVLLAAAQLEARPAAPAFMLPPVLPHTAHRAAGPPPVLRQRKLPPPPEVPAHILEALRPGAGGAGSNSCLAGGCMDDTAASAPAPHPAHLQQATAWLADPIVHASAGMA